MPKIPDCDRCLYCAHDFHLVCSLHPTGPGGETCNDFAADPGLEGKRFKDFLGVQWTTGEVAIGNPFSLDPDENWSPPGTEFVNGELVIQRDDEPAYYNGELIRQSQRRRTREEQLELLDTHPLFTGRCPRCEMPYPQDYKPLVHWDCPRPECGWKDDSV